jgi:hypothetical protein
MTRRIQPRQRDPCEACIPDRIPSLQKARCRNSGRCVDLPRSSSWPPFSSQSKPKATPCFHRVVGKRPARSRTDCCPVPQIIPYSSTLARKIRFRHRNPTAGAWGVRVDNAQKPVVSLAEETGFASFRNRRRKNGFVARVGRRRGRFQGRHKGFYFYLTIH